MHDSCKNSEKPVHIGMGIKLSYEHMYMYLRSQVN
jgi:hypothetical protein